MSAFEGKSGVWMDGRGWGGRNNIAGKGHNRGEGAKREGEEELAGWQKKIDAFWGWRGWSVGFDLIGFWMGIGWRKRQMGRGNGFEMS